MSKYVSPGPRSPGVGPWPAVWIGGGLMGLCLLGGSPPAPVDKTPPGAGDSPSSSPRQAVPGPACPQPAPPVIILHPPWPPDVVIVPLPPPDGLFVVPIPEPCWPPHYPPW